VRADTRWWRDGGGARVARVCDAPPELGSLASFAHAALAARTDVMKGAAARAR
jgi:hypothetical protein